MRDRLDTRKLVPAVAESGYPGFEAVAWFGVSAPAGTARDVVTKLAKGICTAMSDPDIRQQLISHGLHPAYLSPAKFASHDALVVNDLLRNQLISFGHGRDGGLMRLVLVFRAAGGLKPEDSIDGVFFFIRSRQSNIDLSVDSGTQTPKRHSWKAICCHLGRGD
jgi:hypothetical protein